MPQTQAAARWVRMISSQTCLAQCNDWWRSVLCAVLTRATLYATYWQQVGKPSVPSRGPCAAGAHGLGRGRRQAEAAVNRAETQQKTSLQSESARPRAEHGASEGRPRHYLLSGDQLISWTKDATCMASPVSAVHIWHLRSMKTVPMMILWSFMLQQVLSKTNRGGHRLLRRGRHCRRGPWIAFRQIARRGRLGTRRRQVHSAPALCPRVH